jgi:predicted phosphodiesterase
MRLLLFSDIYCDLVAVGRLVEASTNVDVAIGAGDFANMHNGLQTRRQTLLSSSVACADSTRMPIL